MKIAISSVDNTIKSQVDQRFGRCKYFLIVEIEDKKIKRIKAVENQGAIQSHGAGIKAAQQIGELGVEAVITGNIGPNAADVLDKLNIRVGKGNGIVKDAVQDFIHGKLQELKGSSVSSHFGMRFNQIGQNKKEVLK